MFEKFSRKDGNMVMMPKERKPNGFTLIELVVAIAVLSILAGIAIMRYIDATTEAKRNTCLANRTNFSREIAYQEAEGTDPQTFFDQLYTNALYSNKRYRCPKNGTYTFNATTLAVSCSDPDHTGSSIGGDSTGTGGGGSGGGGGTGSTVTASTLGATNWSDKLTSAADSSGGVSLTRGSVFTDSTGVFFVAWGSWLNKETGVAKPTLAEAAASGLGLVKVDTANIWTSANTTTTSNGQTVWTTLPQAGAVYSDGTNYYIHSQSSGNEYTDVNPPTNGNWVKVTNN